MVCIFSANWIITPWGSCSTSCGYGIQRREVVCDSANSDDCERHSTKPSTIQVCKEKDCRNFSSFLFF